MIYYDRRWDGSSGIGRFCWEVFSRLSGTMPLPLSGNPASALDCLRLTLFMLFNPKAVVVSPGYSAPLLGLGRFIITVHDLNHIDTDHNSGLLKRLYYRLVLRRACRNAARVLTVSEFSRSRIIEWAGVSPDQVVCVGNGVSETFLCSAKNNVDRSPEKGFLFCVGNRKGHKNEGSVLHCVAALVEYPHLRLVFSGAATAELSALSESLGLENRVQFTGALTEASLCDHYREAAALVFPSLYEGFGLPAIEAMAVGCPVIASSTTALGEVVGSAGVLINPIDRQSIVSAVRSVLASAELRADLALAGSVRAGDFCWSDVAKRVQSVMACLK